MSTTAARTLAKQNGDISAFVHDIRELNKNALRIVRIVNAPLGSGMSMRQIFRQELEEVLVEMEKTVKFLRVAAVETPSAYGRTQASLAGKPAGKQDGARAALVLDTTKAMVNEKQLVTPVEFQELMGWATRQAVWKAAENHRVFYLSFKAERYFPTFYGDPAYDRKHLEAVTKILGDLPGGSKLQFFLTRKGSLNGDTPLQALAAGRIAKVKDVAAAFAEAPAKA